MKIKYEDLKKVNQPFFKDYKNCFDELGEMRSKIFRREPLRAVMVFKKIFEGLNHNLLTDLERKSFKRDELQSLKFIDDEREMERINQLIDAVEVFPHNQIFIIDNDMLRMECMVNTILKKLH